MWFRIACFLLLILSCLLCVSWTATPPNIVFILADDLGWKEVSFHSSEIQAPQLDALAAQGARLEQFYVQPLCSPTLAALTGEHDDARDEARW